MVATWRTAAGEAMPIAAMDDEHLVNAISCTQRWAGREA